MNGYANAETNFAAVNIINIESLYISARRMTNSFALRNMFVDAVEVGIIAGMHIEVENVDFDEILDTILED